MNRFQHSRYSRIVGYYLSLNGVTGLGYSAWLLYTNNPIANKFVFALTSIAVPIFSLLIGVYVLLRSRRALRISKGYFIAAIPIFGIGTWEYTFAHGLGLGAIFATEIVTIGVNLAPIVGLWLLARHHYTTCPRT